MNVDTVPVNFGFDFVSIPLILVILGCALIGGVVVGSYGIFPPV
ncbi:lipopolysaccharide assembly protein LapA domain-containing protein [Paenibacillus rhizoplanae]